MKKRRGEPPLDNSRPAWLDGVREPQPPIQLRETPNVCGLPLP
jgi:hypothetical protein